MRLALVSQQGQKAAGAEHAILQFVDRLPQGVEIHWFFLEDGEFANAIRKRFSLVTIVPMSEQIARAQRTGLPLRAISDAASLSIRLSRELSKYEPDIVLTNSMKAHIVGSLAAKLANLRCINYIHDIVDGPALNLLRLTSATCATERFTCSKLVQKHLSLPRTTVLYATIAVELFAQLPDRDEAQRLLGIPANEKPVIGLVGRIARWKGQDRFLRIASLVLEHEDAHFCIVGSPIFGCDSDYVDELHAEVTRRGLEDRVTFVPWQESMEHVYAALDIACNCSTREPFGRTSLEALAAGVPVVCFDDAGVSEIFGESPGAISIRAGDEASFAQALLGYLADPQLCAEAKSDARVIAKRIDIGRVFAVFAAALERVAKVKIVLSEERMGTGETTAAELVPLQR